MPKQHKLTVPKENHARIVKALESLPHVETTPEGYVMKHDSGLVVNFTVDGELVTMTIVANPQQVPEDNIRAQVEADIETLSKREEE